MVRIAVFVLLMIGTAGWALPAAAGDAGTCAWSAQIEEDEGGPVMVAAACEEGETQQAPVRLMCGEGINVRLYPGAPLDSNFSALDARLDFAFAAEGKAVARNFVYEDLDGAYAAYLAVDDDLVALLKSAPSVTVTETGKRYSPMAVGLVGSSAAIATLVRSCS
jgi:hypothetical protein